MTEKLRHSAEAFAARVMMGERGLYIFVEGRITDRPFYEQLLERYSKIETSGYQILLPEDVLIDGVPGSGKQDLYHLFDLYKDRGELVQVNKLGEKNIVKNIVFMLDRDYEHVTGTQRSDTHIIYTMNTDVEAEVLICGSIQSAIAIAYGLTSPLVQSLIPPIENLATTLANSWLDWITLGVIASKYGIHADMKHSDSSKVNIDTYGDVDEMKVNEVQSKLISRLDPETAALQIAAVRADICGIFERGEQASLLRGDWICRFIWHLVDVNAKLKSISVGRGISSNAVVIAGLGLLDYDQPWVDHYHSRLDSVLVPLPVAV